MLLRPQVDKARADKLIARKRPCVDGQSANGVLHGLLDPSASTDVGSALADVDIALADVDWAGVSKIASDESSHIDL